MKIRDRLIKIQEQVDSDMLQRTHFDTYESWSDLRRGKVADLIISELPGIMEGLKNE